MPDPLASQSPARRRLPVLIMVLVAAASVWLAVGIARDPASETVRIVLASAGALGFVGMAALGVRALWRIERAPSA